MRGTKYFTWKSLVHGLLLIPCNKIAFIISSFLFFCIFIATSLDIEEELVAEDDEVL